MISFDRRATERRGIAPSATIGLGTVPADKRRDRHDRREQPRRRSDLRTIAHYARRIEAGQTRLEVIVDGSDGLRLFAMFQCGCIAIEPVGVGPVTVRGEPCTDHAEPAVMVDRRRGRR